MKAKVANSNQVSFDEFSWTMVDYSFASSKEARIELGKMMDKCDGCKYRATLGDKRQSECEVCPFRLQMQVIGETLWNESGARVSAKRKKSTTQRGTKH